MLNVFSGYYACQDYQPHGWRIAAASFPGSCITLPQRPHKHKHVQAPVATHGIADPNMLGHLVNPIFSLYTSSTTGTCLQHLAHGPLILMHNSFGIGSSLYWLIFCSNKLPICDPMLHSGHNHAELLLNSPNDPHITSFPRPTSDANGPHNWGMSDSLWCVSLHHQQALQFSSLHLPSRTNSAPCCSLGSASSLGLCKKQGLQMPFWAIYVPFNSLY